MARPKPDPIQVVKERRDRALAGLVSAVPYIRRLGVRFDRRGDELTAILAYDDRLIGNAMVPALHGGAIAAFLEISAIVELAWLGLYAQVETGEVGLEELDAGPVPRLPKTIDFTTDFLRSGMPRDAYARARVNRSGRRYASVYVEAWQDNRRRPFAQATGHFLMPQEPEPGSGATKVD